MFTQFLKDSLKKRNVLMGLFIVAVALLTQSIAGAALISTPLMFIGGFMKEDEEIEGLGASRRRTPGTKNVVPVNGFDAEICDSLTLATGDTSKMFFQQSTANSVYPTNYGGMPLQFSKFTIIGIRFTTSVYQMIQAAIVEINKAIVVFKKNTLEHGYFSLRDLLRMETFGGTSLAANLATDGYGIGYNCKPRMFNRPITITDNTKFSVEVKWGTALTSGLNGIILTCHLYGIVDDKTEKAMN